MTKKLEKLKTPFPVIGKKIVVVKQNAASSARIAQKTKQPLQSTSFPSFILKHVFFQSRFLVIFKSKQNNKAQMLLQNSSKRIVKAFFFWKTVEQIAMRFLTVDFGFGLFVKSIIFKSSFISVNSPFLLSDASLTEQDTKLRKSRFLSRHL